MRNRAFKNLEADPRFLAWVDEGRAGTARGEFVEHDEVMAWLAARIAEHEARLERAR